MTVLKNGTRILLQLSIGRGLGIIEITRLGTRGRVFEAGSAARKVSPGDPGVCCTQSLG